MDREARRTDRRGQFGLAETLRCLKEDTNWGRWGKDDETGAVNNITEEKLMQAACLVKKGRSFSLSRPFPTQPSEVNTRPALHFVQRTSRGSGGHAADFYGIAYHNFASTHIDALCHVWDEDGIYNGREPDDVISTQGASFGGIEKWREGIVTRGVMLDIPRHRGTACVTQDTPVHGWELQDVCDDLDLQVTAGDALIVYLGRDAWERREGRLWGSGDVTSRKVGSHGPDRPGLHASCLEFIRDTDCSVLAWDMMDATPYEMDLPWTVHGAIFAYGLALVDNCSLEALADACSGEAIHEFLFMVAPLSVEGGTGSPVNPLAIL